MRRGLKRFLLASGAAGVAGQFSIEPAVAQNVQPSTTLLSAPAISPAAARTSYGTAATHTNGVAARTASPPEIVALARSLGSEQVAGGTMTASAYTTSVLQWIRANVEIEFRYGLSKGGFGALIDLSGTPFDQAELMVMLLRSAGISASYQTGDITVSVQQFGHWSGLVNGATGEPAGNADLYQEFSPQSFTIDARAACQFLADGGIPATVNGGSSCDSLTGNLSAPIIMSHAWVVANGQRYDPALKMHIVRSGLNLPAAMGCGTTGASTCGNATSAILGGSTAGTRGGATTLNVTSSSPNATTVNTALHQQTMGLLAAIRAAEPDASVTRIVGGTEIAPSAAAASFAIAGVTYANNGPSWSGDVPDQYRTKFSFSAPGRGTCTFFGDELAGRRLRVGGIGISATEVTLDGVAANCGGGTMPGTGGFFVGIDHPYRAGSGTYGDRTVAFQLLEPGGNPEFEVDGAGDYFGDIAASNDEMSVTGSYPVVVVHGFGEASPSAERRMADLEAADSYATTNQCQPSTTMGVIGRTCHYGTMPVMAESIRSNGTALHRIIGGVARAPVRTHDTIGIIYSSRNVGRAYISVSPGISVSNRTYANPGARLRGFETAAVAFPALESFSVADPLTRNIAFYPRPFSGELILVPPAAMANVLASLTPISSLPASAQNRAFETARRQRLQASADAGYTTIMNSNWSIFSGEMFFRNNDIAYTIWASIKGGSAADPVTAAMSTVDVSREARPRPTYSNVNLGDGSLSFSPAPDLVTGSGDFPYSLPFQRTYRGGLSEPPCKRDHQLHDRQQHGADHDGYREHLALYRSRPRCDRETRRWLDPQLQRDRDSILRPWQIPWHNSGNRGRADYRIDRGDERLGGAHYAGRAVPPDDHARPHLPCEGNARSQRRCGRILQPASGRQLHRSPRLRSISNHRRATGRVLRVASGINHIYRISRRSNFLWRASTPRLQHVRPQRPAGTAPSRLSTSYLSCRYLDVPGRRQGPVLLRDPVDVDICSGFDQRVPGLRRGCSYLRK